MMSAYNSTEESPTTTTIPTFSLDALSAFVVLAEELHFTKSASRLHIAQPALTKRIQQIEAAFGVTLFLRTRRSVRLTPDGDALLEKARQTLGSAGELALMARRLSVGDAGQLRIGFTPSAPHHVLPALMREFRRVHPAVACTLTEAGSEDQVFQLLAGDLDLGILRPPVPCPEDLVCTTFLEEPFVAVLPRDHPQAAKRSVRLESLARDPFVMISKRVVATIYNQVLDACSAAGFRPPSIQEATHIHAVVALVAAGAGVTVLPESAARVGVRDVVCRPLRPATLSTIMALAHRRNPRPAVRAFLKASSRMMAGR